MDQRATEPSATPARRLLATKLLRFLLAGLPMFLVAVPLNWLLVTRAQLPKAPAYAIVLLCQTSLNFFICRWFVFTETAPRPLVHRYAKFMSGLMFFRLMDWSVYTLLVSVVGLPYLAVQLGNVAIFALTKFAFAQRVMER